MPIAYRGTFKEKGKEQNVILELPEDRGRGDELPEDIPSEGIPIGKLITREKEMPIILTGTKKDAEGRELYTIHCDLMKVGKETMKLEVLKIVNPGNLGEKIAPIRASYEDVKNAVFSWINIRISPLIA